MLAVMSLIEMNVESISIKKIMRLLPIEIIKKQIVQFYKKFMKTYNGTFYTSYFDV